MKKYDFLAALQQNLSAMDPVDAAEHCAFYEELLGDMMEDGYSEEEAVAKLGDPAELAKKILGEEPPAEPSSQRTESEPRHAESQPTKSWGAMLHDYIKTTVRSALSEVNLNLGNLNLFSGNSLQREQVVSAQDIRSLSIQWPRGEVRIRCDSPDEQLHLTERANEDDPELHFQCTGGTLCIDYGAPQSNGSKELMVRLPASLASNLDRCRLNTSSADFYAEGLRCQVLQLDSSSGDLDLEQLSAEILQIKTSSGDVNLDQLACRQIQAETASGDVEAALDRAEQVQITTRSGDVELVLRSPAQSVSVRSLSGDIDVEGETDSLQLQSTSGDLDFRGLADQVNANVISGDMDFDFARCPNQVQLNATSGDIDLELPPESCCNLRFHSVSGNLETDGVRADVPGASSFSISTISGEVYLHD